MARRVVLVEDDPADVKVLSGVLSRVAPTAKLEVFRDGLNALDFFSRYNPESKDPVVLVLLDLKVPRLEGVDLAQEIRRKLPMRPIPLVVLTGTGSPELMRQAYMLGVNSYVEKIDDPEQSAVHLREVLNYWLNLNRVPE